MELEVRCQSANWHGRIEFMLRAGDAFGKPIVMEDVPEGTCVDPTFHISMHKAQALMDDLWQCGLRPTEGSGSAGSLRATEKHLGDMRKIVSKKIGVEF